jgi:hypothetical protein
MLHKSFEGRVRCLGRSLRLVRSWRFDHHADTSDGDTDGDTDCCADHSPFNFMFLLQRMPVDVPWWHPMPHDCGESRV